MNFKFTESKRREAEILYNNGLSYNQISKKINICKSSVSKNLKSIGLIRLSNKERGQNKKTNTCQQCRASFLDYANRKYCSKKCKGADSVLWDKEKILSYIKDISNYGVVSNSKGHETVVAVARRMFGTWENACNCAGLVSANLNRKADKCLICGEEIKKHERTISYCSKGCQYKGQRLRWSSYRHIRRSIYADGDIISKNKIYKRDGWKCALCFEKINPDLVFPDRYSASIDHIIPISKGGKHILENVQAAHLTCNCRKHTALEDGRFG